jgi:hypothetical protein
VPLVFKVRGAVVDVPPEMVPVPSVIAFADEAASAAPPAISAVALTAARVRAIFLFHTSFLSLC